MPDTEVARQSRPRGLRLEIPGDLEARHLVALPALVLNVMWLPLYSGGRSVGHLHFVEAATFATLLGLLVSGRYEPSQGRWPGRLTLAFGALSGSAFLSTVFSQAPSTSSGELVEWLWLGATGLLVLHTCRSPSARELLVGSLIGALLIQVCWAWFLYWGGSRTQAGTFYGPDQFAGYLLLLLPLPALQAMVERNGIKALGWGSFAIFGYLSLSLAGSRTSAALGALGFVILVFLALRRRPLIPVFIRAVLLVAGYVAAGQLTAHGAGSVLASRSSLGFSRRTRVDFTIGALRIGRRHPYTGAGLGTYGPMFLQVANRGWFWSKWAHNQYSETFADGGVPLAAAWLSLPVVALGGVAGSVRRVAEREWTWLVPLLVGLGAGSLHLLVDHDWSYPSYAATFVTVAAIGVSASSKSQGHEQTSTGPVTRALLATGVAAALVAVVAGAMSANVLDQSRETDVSAARTSTRIAPWSASARRSLGDRLAMRGQRGDLARAADVYRDAIRLDRLNPDLHLGLAAIEERRGDVDAARRAYAAAARVAPGTRVPQLEAEMELRTGNPDRAATVLDRAIRDFERYAPPIAIANALVLRAQVAEELTGPESALPFARRASELAPDAPGPQRLVADLECRAKLRC